MKLLCTWLFDRSSNLSLERSIKNIQPWASAEKLSANFNVCLATQPKESITEGMTELMKTLVPEKHLMIESAPLLKNLKKRLKKNENSKEEQKGDAVI